MAAERGLHGLTLIFPQQICGIDVGSGRCVTLSLHHELGDLEDLLGRAEELLRERVKPVHVEVGSSLIAQQVEVFVHVSNHEYRAALTIESVPLEVYLDEDRVRTKSDIIGSVTQAYAGRIIGIVGVRVGED